MSEKFVAQELVQFFPGTDLFEQVNRLQGETFRKIDQRRTIKVHLGEGIYFAKIHHGVGWKEIFKNLLQGRLPVLGAGNEWRALNRLASEGVSTMEPVLFCRSGANPARQKSAILTRSLEDRISLEDYEPPDPVTKRRLIDAIAGMARDMHGAGINHRDCYLCHFLLKEPVNEAPELHLIDLHRAQIRRSVPDRWLAKDLGGLLFSALEKDITKRDLLRFVRAYRGDLASIRNESSFWRRVVRRAEKLYLQDHPVLPEKTRRLMELR